MIVLEDCPLCKAAGLPPHCPKRLISGGSGRGIVELTGNDLTTKIKEDGLKLSRELHTSERKRANMTGESAYHQQQLNRDRSR